MTIVLHCGDCRDVLRQLPDQSVHCCVSSPPYFGLRDYGVDGQIGLEQTPDAYVAELVAVFRDVRRVLRDDGVLFLNLGDSYWSSGPRQTGRNDTERKTPNGRGGSFRGGARRVIACDTSLDSAYPSYATAFLKSKDLIGIPWRVAFALQADGWYLRQDIIWSKPNPMPESVTDRCTKAHEYIFLLSKSARYYYDAKAVAEAALQPVGDPETATGKGSQHKQTAIGRQLGRSSLGANHGLAIRNKRSVWEIASQPFSEAHFATFPPALIEPCILAGCPKNGMVLDPFGGAGTTGLVADRLQRNCILIELNAAYARMAERRIRDDGDLFADIEVTNRNHLLPEKSLSDRW